MSRILAENRFFMDWWTRGTKKQCDETVYELCDVTVVTRVTVGSLLSVWASVNEASQENGFVKGITLFEVDEMAGVPGFGDAMLAVGWVEETDSGLIFPNFHEHNTVSKTRPGGGSTGAKTAAQRTREWRERKAASLDGCDVTETMSRDVSVTSQCDGREEKRREEKKEPIDARASRLPESWIPDADDVEFCVAERPDLDVSSVADQFRDYWVAQPGAKGRKLDWRATWRNWVRNQKRGFQNGHQGNTKGLVL